MKWNHCKDYKICCREFILKTLAGKETMLKFHMQQFLSAGQVQRILNGRKF